MEGGGTLINYFGIPSFDKSETCNNYLKRPTSNFSPRCAQPECKILIDSIAAGAPMKRFFSTASQPDVL